MTTTNPTCNSFPRSQSYANSDWDYDDVNSVQYDYANSVMGDLEAATKNSISSKSIDATRTKEVTPIKTKSLGTGTISKRHSEHTAATADVSSSFDSTTERTHPAAESSSSSNSDPVTVTAITSTAARTKGGEACDCLLAPQVVTVTPHELSMMTGNHNSTKESKRVSCSAKSNASSVSVPRVLEVPSVIYGWSVRGYRSSQKKNRGSYTANADYDYYDYAQEEPGMPAIPSQQELEDLYEQLRRENCPSQSVLAQRYLYLQQQHQKHMVDKMKAQAAGGLPSPEDEWRTNFVVAQQPQSGKRRRRNGRCSFPGASAAKQAARRRRSSAASRLLAKSCTSNADYTNGTEETAKQRAIELGLDDDIKSTHSRSVISRSGSRLLIRRSHSWRQEDDNVENSGFFKPASNIDVVVDNKQNSVEITRLDNSPYNSNQKRRSVLWRFIALSWKVVTFQWSTSSAGKVEEEPLVESDDECAYYGRNQRKQQQGQFPLPGGIGFPRRGSF